MRVMEFCIISCAVAARFSARYEKWKCSCRQRKCHPENKTRWNARNPVEEVGHQKNSDCPTKNPPFRPPDTYTGHFFSDEMNFRIPTWLKAAKPAIWTVRGKNYAAQGNAIVKSLTENNTFTSETTEWTICRMFVRTELNINYNININYNAFPSHTTAFSVLISIQLILSRIYYPLVGSF